MKRVIEELIRKRESKQQDLQSTINELSLQLQKGTIFRRSNKKAAQLLATFSQQLNELITLGDREWDAYANNHATMVFKSLQWKIEKLEAEYSNVKSLLKNFISLEGSLDRLIASLDKSVNQDTQDRLNDIREKLSVYQYADFELRFRGDENQVRANLEPYLEWFGEAEPLLDIGCGRGEFLQLLSEKGVAALGIDNNASMLELAREKGLNCRQSDALLYLRETEAESIGAIFSAQVIEHFEPEYLRDLVIESLRVLKAGGQLLLETINPLSVFALSHIFTLDVTHRKPLHPEYMRYLLESSGFSQVDVVYPAELSAEKLSEMPVSFENAHIYNSNVDKLNDLLFASPVYAVRGRKT